MVQPGLLEILVISEWFDSNSRSSYARCMRYIYYWYFIDVSVNGWTRGMFSVR